MYNENDIAIVAMACRFPDADTPEQFWQNLKNGKQSLRNLDDDFLRSRGARDVDLANLDYIKKAVIVDDIDKFDATFFGYTPREAELLDPQQRLFLTVCWEAFERSGIVPGGDSESAGVFAGTSFNTYLINCLNALREDKSDLLSKIGGFQSLIHSDKDFIATRTSFKLNLRGPSYSIQSACSTSLLAVHQSCQALLNYECDIALAGGASLSVPQNLGYFHQEGMIFSPDGNCKAFDKDAQGTVVGNGVGVVLLKRAIDAVNCKNPILAVIKGSATNNDGSMKIGFTAPSQHGQTEVIREALGIAEISPDSISYVEAHGTGTTMGDPIEIEALTKAFSTSQRQYCRIGSVKSNIGHLDAAAGIAGLIKLTLMLKHKQHVPSLHYTSANTNIDFPNTPFFVSTDSEDWLVNKGTPRTAGISAFGIGGSNVHLIIQEPAQINPTPSPEVNGPLLIPMTAKTYRSLYGNICNLREHIESNRDICIGDLAYTLQYGKKHFPIRQGYICTSVSDLLNQLEYNQSSISTSGKALVYLFSGQGSQFQTMFAGLYGKYEVFTSLLNQCAQRFMDNFGVDILDHIKNKPLDSTDIAQPAIFSVQIALAKQMEALGLAPKVVIGHSIGEYAAACYADILSLEDAIDMVSWRGKYMSESEPGSMLSITALPKTIDIPAHLTVAVYNCLGNLVVSGSKTKVQTFKTHLENSDIDCRLLRTSHAYHSPMMEEAAEKFKQKIRHISFRPPKLDFVSSMSGQFLSKTEAVTASYWVDQIVNPVRFDSAIENLYNRYEKHDDQTIIPVEIGPGGQLTSILKKHLNDNQVEPISCSRNPKRNIDDQIVFLEMVKHLWERGIDAAWNALQNKSLPSGNTIDLPTYAFERKSYWLGDVVDACATDNIEHSRWEALARSGKKPQHIGEKFDAPTTDIQICLAEIWSKQLGIQNISIDQSFIELGGDSLQSTQVASTINSIFNIKIKSSELREHPTIGELSKLVELRILHFVSSLSDKAAKTVLAELERSQP